jgi:Calx-beta domain
MQRLKLIRWAAVLTLGLTLAPGLASAQETDTLSISGTFHGVEHVISDIEYPGMLGDDLAQVYADGYEQTWTLTLHGVSYSHDYSYMEWNDEGGYGYLEQYITRLHATSFDFQFFGPDADILNEVVSQQLTAGDLTDGAYFELWNGDYFDSNFPYESGPYASFDLRLRPLDSSVGVSFYVTGGGWVWPIFSADGDGYPLVEPRRVGAYYSTITDLRPGNHGGLFSLDDLVDIGSSEPPVFPPTLSIADASAREGNNGTTSLVLTVTRSGNSDVQITVQYRTADGNASSKSDYTSTSGTLTFQPGQTSRTIAVAIKGDRKREPNETFTVRLSNAVGATINDAVATATILNDD